MDVELEGDEVREIEREAGEVGENSPRLETGHHVEGTETAGEVGKSLAMASNYATFIL